ncbi:AMP-binding protein [Brevundimonas sp.]
MIGPDFEPATPPNAILAIDDTGRSLSYEQVRQTTAECRAAWGPQRRLVILLCDNDCRHLEAYLALTAAGHVVVLIGADTSPDIIADLQRRYRVDVVLDATGDWLHSAPSFQQDRPLNPDLSVLLSTSGSTGSPKLVRFSLEQLNTNARAVADYLELTPGERPLAHLPFHYSFGLSIVHSHILAGATLLLSRHSLMSAEFWRRLETERATSLSGVPFHFEMLLRLRLERKDLPALRTLTQAGGRLPPELVSKFAALARTRGWRFFVMYGQTEAGPRLTYLAPERVEAKPGSIGRAIPGVTLELVSEAGVGDEGELVVDSASIMMGYAEAWADLGLGDVCQGRLQTGDLARRDSDGDLTIVGRKSRFIKLQGNRVNLSDVEHRLGQVGFSVTCVGEDDHLWVVTEKDDADAVRRAVVEQFTFPSRSTQIVTLEQIPRSDSGKVLYANLLAQVKDPEGARP